VRDSGLRVEGSRLMAQGLGFRDFRVSGLGFRV